MKILFNGDSITDMGRNRNEDLGVFSYGSGYPFLLQAKIGSEFPREHEIYNRAISGDRIVDVYARIKKDCWNLQPDLISFLVGINDLWHEISYQNGVDAERFDKIYRMLIEDTKKNVPNAKIILIEPFVLHGTATDEKFEEFEKVKERALIVKQIAKDYGCYFLPIQEKFDDLASKYGPDYLLMDGVHPTVVGANVIAEEWFKLFKEKILK